MHVVTKQRPLVRIGLVVEVAMGSLQRLLGYFEQVVPIVNKGIFVRPNAVDDFEPRIITVRVNHQHASAGGEGSMPTGKPHGLL